MNLITKKAKVGTEELVVWCLKKQSKHKEKGQDKPLVKNAQNTIEARVKSLCTLTVFWDKYNVI